MSDTPRTDALLNTTYIGDGTHFVEFSRQLERENAEMAELLERLCTEFEAYASEGNGMTPRICAEARALLERINA